MRGFPKTIGSRQDLENLLALPEHAEQARTELQRLLEGRFVWVAVGPLGKGSAGKTDASHKVVISEADGQTLHQQMQLVEDPQAALFRLGLEVGEAEILMEAPMGDAEIIADKGAEKDA